MVHLAPIGGNGAPGDDAAAVPGRDRLALVRGEEALFAAEVQDLAVVAEDDLLGSAVADQLPHGAHRYRRLNPVGPADAGVVGEVDGVHVHHDAGSRAAHSGRLRVAGRRREHAPQDVGPLLAARSIVAEILRTGDQLAGIDPGLILLGGERRRGVRGEEGIENGGHHTAEFRGHSAAQRVQALPELAEADVAARFADGVVGGRAIGVEPCLPFMGLDAHEVGGERDAGVGQPLVFLGDLAGGGGDQGPLGRKQVVGGAPVGDLGQRRNDRLGRLDPQRSGGETGGDGRVEGRQRTGVGHPVRSEPAQPHAPADFPAGHQRDARDEVNRVTASQPPGEAVVAQARTGSQAHVRRGCDTGRVDPPAQPLECGHHGDRLRVVEQFEIDSVECGGAERARLRDQRRRARNGGL